MQLNVATVVFLFFVYDFVRGDVCQTPIGTGGCICSLIVGQRLMVHCYGEHFKEIPKDIPRNVSRLDISNTNITSLGSDAFKEYSNLYTLVLEGNGLRHIATDAFYSLQDLTQLSLKNNHLTSIPSLQLKSYNTLLFLDLSFNNISTIKRDAFVTLKALKYIRLTGNPLKCDCELGHLKEWIEMRNTWFRIQLIDALCADRNNTALVDVSKFKDCKGLRRVIRVTTRLMLDGEITQDLANEYSKQNKQFDQAVRNQMTSALQRTISIEGRLQVGIVAIGPPNISISVDWIWTTTYDNEPSRLMIIFDETFSKLKTLANYTANPSLLKIFETDTAQVCQSSATENKMGGFYWPATEVGENATVYCPGNTTLMAHRHCESDGAFAVWKSPETDVCPVLHPTSPTTTVPTTNNPVQQRLYTVEGGDPDEIAESIYNLSKKADILTVDQLQKIITILESLVNLDSSMIQGTRQYHITGALSNLYGVKKDTLLEGERRFKTSQRYLDVVYNIIDNTIINDEDMKYVHSNIGFLALSVDPANFNGTSLSILSDMNIKTSSSHLKGDQQTSVYLPSSLLNATMTSFKKNEMSRIAFAVFKDSKMLDPISKSRQPRSLDGKNSLLETTRNVVNSAVIAIRIPGRVVVNLTENVRFRFKQISEFGSKASCEYFIDGRGDWSPKGCHVTNSLPGKYVDCECNHLTNFALLMDVYGVGGQLSKENRTALSIISYIGCALSLTALLMTLLTYTMFRKIRSNSSSGNGRQKTSNPAKIFINLCCIIAMSNVVFLVGEQQYSLHHETGCKMVGAILHFCLLSAITWMAVEGFYMYKALVQVFNTHFSYFLLKTCLVGYGIPCLVVLITIGVNRTNNYGLQAGEICWLAPTAFYATFLAPVCAILIFNFIIFFLVMRKLTGQSGNLLHKADKTKTSQRLRRVMTLVFLFGLTWIFAVFATDGAGIVFQYLFAISNSLQGLFIFIFNIILNKAAIRQWRRKLFGGEEEVSRLTSTKGVHLH